MKVLMAAPYFYPRIGGMENYVFNISKLLVQKYSADVSVVCSNWGREGYKEETIENIKVYRLPYLFKISSTPVNPFWHREITSIILKEKPDIINGHTPVPYLADVACRIAHKEKIPFILTYQNDLVGTSSLFRLLSKSYYRILGFKTLALSSTILVTSQHYAQSSPYLRSFRPKIRIAPVGFDTGRFDVIPKYFSNGNKQVLFVGQLNKASQHKGLDYLIEAMKTVAEVIEGAELLVIGNVDYIAHYKKLAGESGIGNRIKFTGFVPDEELPKYYNQSNVVVLPSYNRAEGFGIVLVEAQACGRPVIGTTVGGIPSAIKDGETGMLVPPKNPQALAQAIIKLLTDKELAKKLGESGYKRAREEFSWEKSAERNYEIYQEILSLRKKA